MAEWAAYWWVFLPVAAEAGWGWVFLPRVRRFFRDPASWTLADGRDPPPTWEADLAWRELFVLYHLPGVAVVDPLWDTLRVRHSLGSVVAVMGITAGVYAAVLRLLSAYL